MRKGRAKVLRDRVSEVVRMSKIPTTTTEWFFAVALAAIGIPLVIATIRFLNDLFYCAIFAAVATCWRQHPDVKKGDKVLFTSLSGWIVQTVTDDYDPGDTKICTETKTDSGRISGPFDLKFLYPYNERFAKIVGAK